MLKNFLNHTEIDKRLLGMILALFFIWVGFDIVTEGLFLSSRNLWNLTDRKSVV